MRVSTRTARFDLHGVRQQVVCIAGSLSRALPPGLAEAPKPGHALVCPPDQGCTNELRSVVSPLWRYCHAKNCRQALSSPREALLQGDCP